MFFEFSVTPVVGLWSNNILRCVLSILGPQALAGLSFTMSATVSAVTDTTNPTTSPEADSREKNNAFPI